MYNYIIKRIEKHLLERGNPLLEVNFKENIVLYEKENGLAGVLGLEETLRDIK